MHTASWLASTSFVFSPSLASFSLPFSAECRGGRGESHRCYWLQATPLFNTPSPNRIQEGRGHRPASFPTPPPLPAVNNFLKGLLEEGLFEELWEEKKAMCGGNVWRGEKKDAIHVCQGCWRNEAMSKPMSKRKKAEELNCFSSLFWSPVFNKTPSEYATLQSRNGDNIPKNFNLNNVRHSHMIYCTCIMSASQLITA